MGIMPADLEPADIVLVHGTGPIARGIQFITRSRWSHAMLIEGRVGDDYGILESISRGVSCGLLGVHYKGADIAAFRLRKWIPREDIIPDHLRGLTPREQIQGTIIEKAKERGRYHYDHLVVLRTIRDLGLSKTLHVFLNILRGDALLEVPHRRDQYAVCSELVQEAYASGGVPLIDVRYLLMPGTLEGLGGVMVDEVWRGVVGV